MKFRKLAGGAVAIVVIVAVAFVAYRLLKPEGPEPTPPIAGAAQDLPDDMSRGEYLTKAADCAACHTEKGGTPFAGGRPFQLPFGTIYATNLTPDEETGIGKWSDEAFVAAVREGVGSEGHLYPAMPYTSYTGMSRDDILAIKAYLESLPPVNQPTPENSLSFPFNQRWGMAFWNLAFFDETRFTPDSDQSDAWNRGAYLAGPLGHCGECHTPRNIGFAMQSHDYLAGTEVQGWKAYNTTSDSLYGIGSWSDDQLRGYLSRGHAPGRSSASGPMAEVVEYSLQHLTDGDIDALIAYLRSVEPEQGDRNVTVNVTPAAVEASNAVLPGDDAPVEDPHGRRLFEGDCAGCHQWNGIGRQTEYASLGGSSSVNDPTGTALIQVLLRGTSIEIDGVTQRMPGFGGVYSDTDIAAVANYVLAHFGDKEGTVTADEVAERRAGPAH
ncbi:cytochrome c [Salinicola avicenniae]|uniref:cytochrome c n=1 Tax=Salinicola avicenniae TaxID=2916836 RepID=UPI002073DB12|nr:MULTISPECIES: cytochrome c [unclassified Salinicola]